jgi:hypothetical protein
MTVTAAGYGLRMPLDQALTARGALAGALGAAVWAAQTPLDQRAFGVAYSDSALLGKTVTRGPAWPVVGHAMHLANGALFGAVYANVARRIPLPSWARGPAAGMTENLATWPLMAVVDRFHPARKDLPKLALNPRAFAQATWRHLLFGLVMGEAERRLNAPADPEVPSYEHVASTNGHGNLETALSGQPG